MKKQFYSATGDLQTARSAGDDCEKGFRPLALIIPVILVLVLIGWGSRWYADGVTLPRYCENTAVTVQLLEQVMVKDRPAGRDSRLPYLIVAKLLFLVPRQGDENVPEYLERVEHFLYEKCH
ncbi:MAG: hypothetical protein ACE5GZ_13625 [Gammaproteobacteria bacterium]